MNFTQVTTTTTNEYIQSIETNAPIFRYIDDTPIRITKEDLISLFLNYRDYHCRFESFSMANQIPIELAQKIVVAGSYFYSL